MNISKLAREMLLRGIDDWVPLCEVINVVREARPNGSPDEVREELLRTIGELRDGGYARVGHLMESGFQAWPSSTEETLRRIDEEWRALGTPNLGDVAWMENTPVGNRIALELWKSRRP